MKRLTLIATLAATLMGAGVVAAQAPSPKAPDPHAGHHPDTASTPAAAKGKGPEGEAGMAGGKKGKMGMMGDGKMGMMGDGKMGMCPGMMGAGAKMEVVKLPKGVTITLTSDDPKVVARVQKMAEGMRLMHEANAQ